MPSARLRASLDGLKLLRFGRLGGSFGAVRIGLKLKPRRVV